eukprot:4451121-Amphidinium_carterae.1
MTLFASVRSSTPLCHYISAREQATQQHMLHGIEPEVTAIKSRLPPMSLPLIVCSSIPLGS